MTDEQMKKLLEEDTGEVPERFHQAMLAAFGQIEDEPFDGTELPISVETAEKPRRPRHVPRQGGRFRRMMLVMLITLGLLGGLAVATTANPRLLEVFWGKDFEPSAQASAYIAHDLAEMETSGYRVRVEEAVYDGMTLYVRYSIRDMSCDHLLGETNVDTGRRMLNEQEITAFDHAPVVDGQSVVKRAERRYAGAIRRRNVGGRRERRNCRERDVPAGSGRRVPVGRCAD